MRGGNVGNVLILSAGTMAFLTIMGSGVLASPLAEKGRYFLVILEFFRAHPVWFRITEGITFLGTAWVALPAILWLGWKSRKHSQYRKVLVVWLAGGILLAITVQGIKHVFHTPRPLVKFPELAREIHMQETPRWKLEPPRYWKGFPSGHTATAFFIYPACALWWGMSGLWMFLAVAVGVSRILLFQHTVEDVLGGMAIGWLFFLVCTLATRSVLSRHAWNSNDP